MPLSIFLAKIFKLLTSPTKGKLSMPLVHKSRSSTLVSILEPETSSAQLVRDDLLGLGLRLDLMTYDILVEILSYLDFYGFSSARLVSVVSLTTSITGSLTIDLQIVLLRPAARSLKHPTHLSSGTRSHTPSKRNIRHSSSTSSRTQSHFRSRILKLSFADPITSHTTGRRFRRAVRQSFSGEKGAAFMDSA